MISGYSIGSGWGCNVGYGVEKYNLLMYTYIYVYVYGVTITRKEWGGGLFLNFLFQLENK